MFFLFVCGKLECTSTIRVCKVLAQENWCVWLWLCVCETVGVWVHVVWQVISLG